MELFSKFMLMFLLSTYIVQVFSFSGYLYYIIDIFYVPKEFMRQNKASLIANGFVFQVSGCADDLKIFIIFKILYSYNFSTVQKKIGKK